MATATVMEVMVMEVMVMGVMVMEKRGKDPCSIGSKDHKNSCI